MTNCIKHFFFTKEEVDHIRDQISLHCHWNDKVMNKLDDLFQYMEFPEDYLLQVDAQPFLNREPKQELLQKK